MSQSLAVKRAEVEFHKFACMGEPERAERIYREQNDRRRTLLRQYPELESDVSPFLEIGANAGHSSYMLSNEFGLRGFALDLSADSLRNGQVLRKLWSCSRSPMLLAGDALRLPFKNGSIRAVFAYQMLSQFQQIEQVLDEVCRVLVPGGLFLFAEEPVRRKLTLNLFRYPYPERMKRWEKAMYRWGVLDYLAADVIGADQEESFGIRQNHRMGLSRWAALLSQYFVEQRYTLFAREDGWANAAVRRMVSVEKAADLLGGTLAAICRKAGSAPFCPPQDLTTVLACPDCWGDLRVRGAATLHCQQCGYAARAVEEVYNLLPSSEKRSLYQTEPADGVRFSEPDHEHALVSGFYELEGHFGARYRWMSSRGVLNLVRRSSGPVRLRVRGFVHPSSLERSRRVEFEIAANGKSVLQHRIGRPGLFVLDCPIDQASTYHVEILAKPVWVPEGDDREVSVVISAVELIAEGQGASDQDSGSG